MEKRGSSRPGGDNMEYRTALHRAAGLCSRQEQCTSHILDKLREWNVSDNDSEKVIRMLKEDKFLDDTRFAGFYAKDKFRLNGWGKIKITHMLRQKHISGEVIDQALGMIDEEAYRKTCLELIRAKSASLNDKNLFSRKGKLYRFAAGRGFEPELIHRALNEIEKE
ncbi:MAG: regulatory protein RecX [Bacteroidota bacterium]